MNEIVLERIGLADIPRYDLPEGYRIVTYRPGDEIHWNEIHRDADKYTDVTDDLFASQFGSDVNELSRRQFYLHHGDEVIGTASAWHSPTYKDGTYGRVHWVAIKTAYQGRGLSKSLMTEVCLALARLGHEKAYLTTSGLRPVAIRLYEKFGFKTV